MVFSFLFINKYLKKPLKVKEKKKKKAEEMVTPCTQAEGGPSPPTTQGCCCTAPCLGLKSDPTNTSSKKQQTSSNTITTIRATRSNFAKSTASTLFPNTKFTNHESLPLFSEAFSTFTELYPEYIKTQQADCIRSLDYSHLSNHVCLDYTGFSLFSHSQTHPPCESSSAAASSSSAAASSSSAIFGISYKSASLKSQVQYGSQETGMETSIKNRIMSFLNISEEDYGMVCTANRTTAFRLLAETYPFLSNKRLLTVYDHDSEAVSAMKENAQKRGAKVMSASFSWPSLRIQSSKLKKMLMTKRKNKKRGLLVFPLQSRMTGARYPYLWMKIAQDNGWHVVLDACALGPKDLDTLGLSLIQPDFIICSFFKVFGENPSGFATLFIKKSSGLLLETSAMARSIGVVSIIATRQAQFTDDFSSSSFSGPIPTLICNKGEQVKELEQGPLTPTPICSNGKQQVVELEQGETSALGSLMRKEDEELEKMSPEIMELQSNRMKCVALDHADALGLVLIRSRLRYITNWLVVALTKLRYPHSENGHSLVKIYGPRIKFERGPAIAFNLFDWKGEKVEPALVQKLADRSNISLSCGFLNNIGFSDKYEEDRDAVLERRVCEIFVAGKKRKEHIDLGISVVNASLGFLANFEDAYKFWTFVAKFLDADFVEKERWRYMALNQKMIEV